MVFAWTVFASTLTAASEVSAELIPGYSDDVTESDAREVALLPSYCMYTQIFRNRVPGGDNPAEIARWYQTLGPTFNSLHHYCWGLMKTNRALLLAPSQQVRSFYLKSAIGEFDYVIQRATPDFVLLPEILTKKGEDLFRLKEDGLAVMELNRAISLKPDYWPPYAALSDHYKEVGNPEKARELLDKALSFAPDAKGLKSRQSELNTTKR